MYAKLINGDIEFAPINKITQNKDGTHDVIFNYGQDATLLTQDGFLPYFEEKVPIITERQTLSFEYVQDENGITKKYTVI